MPTFRRLRGANGISAFDGVAASERDVVVRRLSRVGGGSRP